MAAANLTLLEAESGQLLAAVKALLEAKGIASQAEIADRVAATDRASPGQGALMVARAWLDSAYRALLLQDGSAAAEQAGIPMRGMPPLGVLANEPGLHHLVVCTLCSCYPRAVLGYPPFWFKSAAYRARAVRGPCGRAGRVAHRAATGHGDPRGGQHRRLSLDGAAAAPAGHAGLGRG